jgi:hypothetical protein
MGSCRGLVLLHQPSGHPPNRALATAVLASIMLVACAGSHEPADGGLARDVEDDDEVLLTLNPDPPE